MPAPDCKVPEEAGTFKRSGLGVSVKQVTDPTGDVALALAHHLHFTDGKTKAQSRLKASVA